MVGTGVQHGVSGTAAGAGEGEVFASAVEFDDPDSEGRHIVISPSRSTWYLPEGDIG